MGLLDNVLRGAVTSTLALLVSDTATLVRRVRTYNPTDDSETEIDTTLLMKISPPLAYKAVEINGSIHAGDMKVFADAETIEAAGFDPIPGSDASVYLTVAGLSFKVIEAVALYSGDQVAAYRLQLRK